MLLLLLLLLTDFRFFEEASSPLTCEEEEEEDFCAPSVEVEAEAAQVTEDDEVERRVEGRFPSSSPLPPDDTEARVAMAEEEFGPPSSSPSLRAALERVLMVVVVS